ncbi:hypothetical protein EYC84_010456 [Monilinia fructicola]|uniref:Uncharacterized protein n=1 Tax=Monilinia fructicola TaxID=38448 RepID=A0A5M9JI11_MONFR|nr:hypothetical protein EYC84_010456 [Monilinia fructicola]
MTRSIISRVSTVTSRKGVEPSNEGHKQGQALADNQLSVSRAITSRHNREWGRVQKQSSHIKRSSFLIIQTRSSPSSAHHIKSNPRPRDPWPIQCHKQSVDHTHKYNAPASTVFILSKSPAPARHRQYCTMHIDPNSRLQSRPNKQIRIRERYCTYCSNFSKAPPYGRTTVPSDTDTDTSRSKSSKDDGCTELQERFAGYKYSMTLKRKLCVLIFWSRGVWKWVLGLRIGLYVGRWINGW